MKEKRKKKKKKKKKQKRGREKGEVHHRLTTSCCFFLRSNLSLEKILSSLFFFNFLSVVGFRRFDASDAATAVAVFKQPPTKKKKRPPFENENATISPMQQLP